MPEMNVGGMTVFVASTGREEYNHRFCVNLSLRMAKNEAKDFVNQKKLRNFAPQNATTQPIVAPGVLAGGPCGAFSGIRLKSN